MYVYVRGTCAFARGWCACAQAADEEHDDRPLLVANAVLIIMLIEISTAAKIDGCSPSGFHARIPNRLSDRSGRLFDLCHATPRDSNSASKETTTAIGKLTEIEMNSSIRSTISTTDSTEEKITLNHLNHSYVSLPV